MLMENLIYSRSKSFIIKLLFYCGFELLTVKLLKLLTVKSGLLLANSIENVPENEITWGGGGVAG